MFELVQGFDEAFLLLIQSISFEPFITLFYILTQFGSPLLWFGVATYVYWTGREREGFHLMNLVLLTVGISGFFKTIFDRPRPDEAKFFVRQSLSESVFGNQKITNAGFPSSHAAMAGGAVGYYWNIVKQNQKTLLVLLALIIPLSRMVLGQHFFTDVLVGLFLGIFLGKIIYWSKNKLEKYSFEPTLTREIEIGLAVIAFGAAMLWSDFPPIFGALMGFYAGFFSLKKAYPLEYKGRSLKKEAFGFLVLFAILWFSIVSEGIVSLISFFVLGLWVSFIYPWLHHKFAEPVI